MGDVHALDGTETVIGPIVLFPLWQCLIYCATYPGHLGQGPVPVQPVVGQGWFPG